MACAARVWAPCAAKPIHHAHTPRYQQRPSAQALAAFCCAVYAFSVAVYGLTRCGQPPSISADSACHKAPSPQNTCTVQRPYPIACQRFAALNGGRRPVWLVVTQIIVKKVQRQARCLWRLLLYKLIATQALLTCATGHFCLKINAQLPPSHAHTQLSLQGFTSGKASIQPR